MVGLMGSMRWCSFAIVLCDMAFSASAASNDKDVVSIIQCAVCKQAVKEASHQTKEHNKQKIEDDDDDEDALTNIVDNLCEGQQIEKGTGRRADWITKVDIVKTGGMDNAQLALDVRATVGECGHECKLVRRACKFVKNEETLVSMLKDRAGVGRLQRTMCKELCEKKVPKLGQWTDEVFKPITEKTTKLPAPGDYLAKFTPVFSDLVASTLAELAPTVSLCYTSAFTTEQITHFLTLMTEAADDMMQAGDKESYDKMQLGFGKLGTTFTYLGTQLTELCGKSELAQKVEGLGSYLTFLTSKFEDLSQKVGGHDLNKLLKSLLVAGTKDPADGKAFGQALGKLFKAFEIGSGGEHEAPQAEL